MTKPNMTKRESLEICIKMWTWLAENPFEAKLAAVQTLGLPPMECSCAACEYDAQFGDDCRNCPIWENEAGVTACEKVGSPYCRWQRADRGSSLKAQAAFEVADLAREKLRALED